MYRAQTDFYQTHGETTNEAQLACIMVLDLYMVHTSPDEKVKRELLFGASMSALQRDHSKDEFTILTTDVCNAQLF